MDPLNPNRNVYPDNCRLPEIIFFAGDFHLFSFQFEGESVDLFFNKSGKEGRKVGSLQDDHPSSSSRPTSLLGLEFTIFKKSSNALECVHRSFQQKYYKVVVIDPH